MREGVTLEELAGAAGLRWTIEDVFCAPRMISGSIIARRIPGGPPEAGFANRLTVPVRLTPTATCSRFGSSSR